MKLSTGAGVGLLATLLAVSIGCGGGDLPGPDVAAQIEGRSLLVGDFEAYQLRNLGEAETGLSSAVLSSLFDKFLDEELLWRMAEEEELVRTGGPRDVSIRMLLLDRAIEISDADVVAYYEGHREEFDLPERIRLRQVLVRDRSVAENIRTALLAGSDFHETVTAESTEESDTFLGEQGQVTRDELPAQYVDAIFALAPGEVSSVVAADYGYHVFQVVERWPAERVPVERVSGQIRGILHGERAEAQLGRLLDEARSRYSVRVFERNLPFNYEGRLQESPDEVE